MRDSAPSVAATRELAHRVSGTTEVFLLWRPMLDRLELAVRDLVTDASFHLHIAPRDALDAFYHPFAYAARRPDPRQGVGAPV
jgi:hypothetical protein